VTAQTFAQSHARQCARELSRYLLAGVALSELTELVSDLCIALEVVSATQCGGGEG
jgi:hypothetical protein